MNDNEPAADPVVDFLVADKFFGRIDQPRTPECPPDGVLFDWEMGQPIDPAVRAHVESGCVFCAAKRAVFGGWLGTRSLPRTGDDLPLLRRFAKSAPDAQPAIPQPLPGVADETSVSPTAVGAGGLTDIFVHGTPDVIRRQFAPVIRLLASMVGFPVDLSEPFVEFVLGKRKDLNGRRFRHVINDWLAEFARSRGAAPPARALAAAELEQAADLQGVRDAVATPVPDEPDWTRRVRDQILAQNVASWEELTDLKFPPEVEQEPRLGGYLRAVADTARQSAAAYRLMLV